MIDLRNKDNYIYDLEYCIVDIVNEYQTTGKVWITTNNEGICLEHVGFYKILDYICEKFNIDKSNVHIHTRNLLEKHNEYKIYPSLSHWVSTTKTLIPKEVFEQPKLDNLYTTGCFIGRINWSRLILLSWLHKNFLDKTLLTCHYYHDDSQKLNSELTELNFHGTLDDLIQAVEFLSYTPITLDEEKFPPGTIGPPEHLNILRHYDKIFLDIVAETYVLGNTFFPTEKTLRPIMAKTPFIVLGPKNYLHNLKKLGYMTFDRWWNESYDQIEGISRINEIKKVLTEIMQWPQDRLQQTLVEMEEILEHNKQRYLNGKK